MHSFSIVDLLSHIEEEISKDPRCPQSIKELVREVEGRPLPPSCPICTFKMTYNDIQKIWPNKFTRRDFKKALVIKEEGQTGFIIADYFSVAD